MSPTDRTLLKALAGRPMFRCPGGWRRGSTKITGQRGRRMVADGLFRQTSNMLVPTEPGSRKGSSLALGADAPAEGERRWWVD